MEAVKAPALNSAAHVKARLLTLCAQIEGIITPLEDMPEVPFLPEALPALVIHERGAVSVIFDKPKGIFQTTRTFELVLYVTPCAPDTGSVERLGHLSSFLQAVPGFFMKHPRLQWQDGGIAVSSTLPTDSGNDLRTVGDTTYISTTFSIDITTRHMAQG